MLERIALHQTRLHTPGLALDAKGVALGTRGWVVVASIDRLVAFLAAYTHERSLEDLLPTVAIHEVRSELGVRAFAFEFAAESSDRMDRVAEAARLVGGQTFTGSLRHFVRYRDAAAPFGYDATEIVAASGALVFYGAEHAQTYEIEAPIDLRTLLLRLVLRPAGGALGEGGPRLLVAEAGLGPALVHYLVRGGVPGEVTVIEWAAASVLDEAPLRRWLLRLPEVPPRMRGLLSSTPGIRAFAPAAPGIAVEAGYRHPIELRACPVFDPAGLVLLRAADDEPWIIDRLPAFGDLAAFARVELRAATEARPGTGVDAPAAPLAVALRLAPSVRAWPRVTATWIAPEGLPLLRALAYCLPRSTLAQTRAALTARGALLRCPAGIEGIPLGTFLVEIAPQLYVPAGYTLLPAAAPAACAAALGAGGSRVVFLDTAGGAFQLDEAVFAPLEALLLDAPAPLALAADPVTPLLDATPIEITLDGPGGTAP